LHFQNTLLILLPELVLFSDNDSIGAGCALVRQPFFFAYLLTLMSDSMYIENMSQNENDRKLKTFQGQAKLGRQVANFTELQANAEAYARYMYEVIEAPPEVVARLSNIPVNTVKKLIVSENWCKGRWADMSSLATHTRAIAIAARFNGAVENQVIKAMDLFNAQDLAIPSKYGGMEYIPISDSMIQVDDATGEQFVLYAGASYPVSSLVPNRSVQEKGLKILMKLTRTDFGYKELSEAHTRTQKAEQGETEKEIKANKVPKKIVIDMLGHNTPEEKTPDERQEPERKSDPEPTHTPTSEDSSGLNPERVENPSRPDEADNNQFAGTSDFFE